MTTTIVTRASKGSILEWAEMDTNWENLKATADGAATAAQARDLRGPVLSSQVPVIWDDFDDVDQVLNGRVCPSGQTWIVSGPGAATIGIVDGELKQTGLSQNFYASLDSPTRIQYIGGVFSYRKGAGTDQDIINQCTLIVQNMSKDLGTMLHLQLTPTGWMLQKRLAGGAFTTILSGSPYDRQADESPYFCGMEIVGNTVTVYSPSGEKLSVTDADIAAMELLVGTWQITGGASAPSIDGTWHSVGIGKVNKAATSGFDLMASTGHVARLAGYGYGRRNSATHTITAATGDGWYRIAGHTLYSAYYINALFKISANGTLNSSYSGFMVGKSGQTPTETTQQMYGSYHLNKVRIGTEANAVYVDVYITNTAASTVTLTVDVEGWVDLYAVPIPAPATPANVVTRNMVTTVSPPILEGVATTADWYRVATQISGPSGWVIYGKIRLKAQDASRYSDLTILVAAKDSVITAIQVIDNLSTPTNPITQVRISREAGLIAVDIYTPYAATNNLTITGTYEDHVSIPSSLVIGTALATETITKTVYNNAQNIKIALTDPIRDLTTTYTTYATGSTHTATSSETGIYQTGAAIADLTVTLPPAPVDGHTFEVASVAGISGTLQVNAAAGHTGAFTISALAAQTTVKFRFKTTGTTWYRVQ